MRRKPPGDAKSALRVNAMKQDLFGWTYESNTLTRSCLQGEDRDSTQPKDNSSAVARNILNPTTQQAIITRTLQVYGYRYSYTHTMKKSNRNLAVKSFDMNAIRKTLDDMRRACGGGDIPPKMISSAARSLKLSVDELAEAAGRLNRPFANNHVR